MPPEHQQKRAQDGLISELPPAALQFVIRGLGRKNKRAHVILSTCWRSRSRRGYRWPAVDAENYVDHSLEFSETEVNDKQGAPRHGHPSAQCFPW